MRWALEYKPHTASLVERAAHGFFSGYQRCMSDNYFYGEEEKLKSNKDVTYGTEENEPKSDGIYISLPVVSEKGRCANCSAPLWEGRTTGEIKLNTKQRTMLASAMAGDGDLIILVNHRELKLIL